MQYLEKAVETYLCKEVKKRGGLCIKQDSEAGLPDRLVLMPGGRHAFAELKRPGGRVSAIQAEYHRRLRAIGHEVAVLYDFGQVDEFRKKHFNERGQEDGLEKNRP